MPRSRRCRAAKPARFATSISRQRRRAANRTRNGRVLPRDPPHVPGRSTTRQPRCRDVATRLNHSLGGHRRGFRDRRSESTARYRPCRIRLRPPSRISRSPLASSIPAIVVPFIHARTIGRSRVADSLRRDCRGCAVVPLVDGRVAHPAGCRQHPRPRRDCGGAGRPRGAGTADDAGSGRGDVSRSDRRQQRRCRSCDKQS